MTRLARNPQGGCGRGRARVAELVSGYGVKSIDRAQIPGRALSSSLTALIACSFIGGLAPMATVPHALAQTSTLIGDAAPNPTTFPKTSGNLLPSTNVDRSQPLYLQGDQLIYESSGDSVRARGNVEIYYNDYALTADEVVYDQSANTLTAVGNVVLREPNGNVIRADRYTLTDDFRDGFVQSLSVVSSDDTRIAARQATRRDGNVTEFSDAKFTPCKSDGSTPPLWCISSSRIVHDKDAATVTYQDAQFEIFGQPIVYLPYFQHPDPSVKRRSGFLPPAFGTSSDLGFTTTVPYYFALAPNYDVTLAPTFSTKQGVLYQGEWRHRLANGAYNIQFAGIDQRAGGLPDAVTAAEREDLEGFRGSLKTQGLFSLSSWWSLGWDVTLETDDTFRRFYKLDGRLITDRVNRIYSEGISDRNYFRAELYQFGGLLLDDNPQAESRVHPVIDYNYIFAGPIVGGELSWDTNAYSLTRDDKITSGANFTEINQDAARATTELTWRRKLIDSIGITYTPFANLRGDVTHYNNFRHPFAADPLTAPVIEGETVAQGVAAGGVTISYPWIASTAQASHTIEPIGQIIARTEANPNRDRPNEDARSLVFDDTNLFTFDKFSGFDRSETGTRANVGVQYTFQLNQGGGYARLLAGQSFQLSGNNPFENPGRIAVVEPTTGVAEEQFSFNPASGLETDRSDYVVGAYIAPTSNIQLISQTRLDEDTFELRREDASLTASLGPFNATAIYSYTAADPERGIEKSEQDIYGGIGIQLTERWSIAGYTRYDIDASDLLSDAIRVRYADECFIMTATYQETFYNDVASDIDTDRSVYFTFEFKHLGLIDYRTDIFGDDTTNAN